MIVSKIKSNSGAVTYISALTAQNYVEVSLFSTKEDFNNFEFDFIADQLCWSEIETSKTSPKPEDGDNTAVLSLADIKAIKAELHNVIRWALKIRPRVEFNSADKARFKATMWLLRKGSGFEIDSVYDPKNSQDAFVYLRKANV